MVSPVFLTNNEAAEAQAMTESGQNRRFCCACCCVPQTNGTESCGSPAFFFFPFLFQEIPA